MLRLCVLTLFLIKVRTILGLVEGTINLIAAAALGIHKGYLTSTTGELRLVLRDSDTASILTLVVFGSAIDIYVLEQNCLKGSYSSLYAARH